MKTLIVKMTLASLFLANQAIAAEAPKKAVEAPAALTMPADGKSKCGTCHEIEAPSVGPAWKEVAAKYKGKADAEKTLIANITKGGKFGWYPDKPMKSAMPAKGMGANEAQIAALAKFIAIDMNKGAVKPKELTTKSHDHK